jgi:hypothetical protein
MHEKKDMSVKGGIPSKRQIQEVKKFRATSMSLVKTIVVLLSSGGR